MERDNEHRKYCVSVRNLVVSFGEHEVLHGVNVDFPFKQVSALLGRSGSGKTTLLRSLNRLNEHFENYSGQGEVSVVLNGNIRSVHAKNRESAMPLDQLRRLVGMVFQAPNPLPLSIRKNIILPLTLVAELGKDEAEEAMSRVLNEVGLWNEVRDRLDRPAQALSGGQQQRLCLARALALKPEILLLDEPTASLDRAAASRIEELILSFKGRYSIIMISHSLSQARKLADFIAILTEGRIEETLSASALPNSNEAELLLERLIWRD
ncbi:MAG: ATP-binding cassette domain-containing protein [Synergistaceae bacterium]|nr:ATP-binding cassette domain-containing protein [Synergistaceae bacterium]